MSITETSHVPQGAAALGEGQSDRRSMNRTSQLVIAWSGFAMLALILGGLLIGRFLPPWVMPHHSAEKAADIYSEHSGQIRFAVVLTLTGFGLIGVWGAGLAAQTRRKEGVFPVLTYCQLTCMAAGTALLMLQSCLWAVAAFRAGEISPEITQTLNDAAYIVLLSTWMPFACWAWALAAAILLDKSDNPVYPRWSAYVCIATGIMDVPGNTVWFFKDGAFGWAGAICLYVPIAGFGVWVAVMTILTVRNIKSGLVHEQQVEAVPLPQPAP